MEQYRCYGCMQLISEPTCPHCGHPSTGVNAAYQLPVGTVLAGRYFIGRAVDQTAQTIVYTAWDQSQDKAVQICEFYPGDAAKREEARVLPAGDFGRRLELQSKTASLLTAVPELARVSGTLDSFCENGTVYLAREQVRGPGLELYIRRRGGMLEAQEALRILHDAVGALAILHQNGCAHGSIGLNRIVLDPMGGARLLGFCETPGGDPAEDVYAISKLICDSIAPGGALASVAGLSEQQQMALDMGTRPSVAERFSNAVALRRALYGEATVQVGPVPMLQPQLSPEPETAPEPEVPVIPVIPVPEVPEAPEAPEVPAEAAEAAPGMPVTEAITSDVLPSVEPKKADTISEPPVIAPFPVPPASSMPATEIVSEFKIRYPSDPQPEAPQPEKSPLVSQVPLQEEMPRTEAAQPVPPPWDAQPQWNSQQQPDYMSQWNAPQQPPKKKTGLIVGIVVGVVVLIAALVLCFLFVHVWKDATCEEPKTCALCGKTEGKALGHEWEAATCEAPKTCSVCGETEGSALPHAWMDGSCEEPRTCAVCGATEGSAPGHAWVDATCDTPKTCSVCGKTEGSALGHSWKDATYTEPKTCSRCGKTEGEPKGYMEYVSGEFVRFSWGNSNTSSYVFDKPVKGCSGFTLFFEPTFNYNSWVDDWKLLYQDTSGVWHEYGAFTLNTDSYEHVFNFSPRLDIKAIAVVPRINGSYSYSFSLGVWYLYYSN